jgi:Na+/melibiose symporter-like transporter
MFLVAFRNLKETAQQQRQRLSVHQSIAALHGNVPWLITFIGSLLFWIAFIARISAAPFYFQYVLHRPALVSFANSLDAVSLVSILLLPFFCRLTSKRNVWALGLAGCVLGQVIVFIGTQSHSVSEVMTGWTVGFLASGVAMALPFSILATSVDYGEWKSGIRASGFLTAIGAAFCLKAGSGLGGALPAWIMNWYGYIPNVGQTANSLHGIMLSCIWVPAVAYALAAIPVLFYGRYERHEATIQNELAERWRELEAAAQP